MQTVRENTIEIIRIKSETTISLGKDTVTLTPQVQKIKSKMMEYSAWHVTGSVKGIALDCISHKANKKKAHLSLK
jgi:hypothetical protein